MLAAAALVCHCGELRSVCSNPDIDWHPQESVCWKTGTQQWGRRRLEAQHKDYPTHNHRGEPLMNPLDGVSVWVSEVDIEALSGAARAADGE